MAIFNSKLLAYQQRFLVPFGATPPAPWESCVSSICSVLEPVESLTDAMGIHGDATIRNHGIQPINPGKYGIEWA